MGTPAYQVTVVLDKRLFAIIASYRKRMEAASPGMRVSISNAIRGLIARAHSASGKNKQGGETKVGLVVAADPTTSPSGEPMSQKNLK
jgi:hypothetical protein